MTSSNKIVLNKIVLNKIVLNKIVLNKIVLNQITSTEFELDNAIVGDLLNGDAGDRAVLEYLISCAFPEGVTLTGYPDSGPAIDFYGGVGVAERWSRRGLTFKERRWVSACMLSRVNKDGTEVQISLRGPHDALVVTAEERNEFSLEEGAYYGDIFDNAQKFYACRGADLYAGNLSFALEGRSCAQPLESGDLTQCGMTYAGECDAFNVERACDRSSGEYYERCHTYPTQNGRWHDEDIETRYEEAITVWVKPR